MKLTRREFIKISSIASATLLPVANAISQQLGAKDCEILQLLNGSFDRELEFHVIDNNLLNIHFYFINVARKKRYIIPANESRRSFMIVRLPQQHISEKGFWEADWTNNAQNKPAAFLSGFSYLAFQLWGDVVTPDIEQNKFKVAANKDKRLKFTLDNILNWNDESNLELITLFEWFKLKNVPDNQFRFINYPEQCDEFKNKKIWKAKQDYVCDERNEPRSEIYFKYKSIIRTLFDGNLNDGGYDRTFIPITFFELPQEVCLVPIYPSHDKNNSPAKVRKRFWRNKYINQDRVKEGTRTYEIWNNTLFYQNSQTETTSEPQNAKANSFELRTPSFRIAGLITGRDPGCPQTPPDCSATPNANNVIPTLLNKAELTHLTQFAKTDSLDFTGEEFDIKEINGFFFTGLGAITHLKYYNVENVPPGIDLIEYEHRITQGRDLFVKVARLGYNSKTGQRYKHVIEATRRIESDGSNPKKPPRTSFLELKQYCECIDKTIAYSELPAETEWGQTKYFPINSTNPHPIINPAFTNECHFRRNLYTELTVTERKRIPIDCLQDALIERDVCVLEGLRWFWAVRESAYNPSAPDSVVKIEDYLKCEYVAKDWEGKTVAAQTPFMFIRKSYIERLNGTATTPAVNDTTAFNNYFKGNYDNSNDPLMERRKTFLTNQKVAFTPTPPKNSTITNQAEAVEQGKKEDSKTNIIETEFFESYFNIKKTSNERDAAGNLRPIDKISYVVFPQILRAKIFIDHIKDLTQKKLPSVIEYHADYIKHAFNPTDSANNYANATKLILKNTEAYLNKQEEKANQTYDEIRNALQEAKDKLGNLATPDIIPDTVSLEKFGITLPKDVNRAIQQGRATFNTLQGGIKEIEKFSPRELLRGKFNEILGGIDLLQILDELIPANSNENATPLFEIKKLIERIDEVTRIIDEEYRRILDAKFIIFPPGSPTKVSINDLKRTINEISDSVSNFERQIAEKEREIKVALIELSKIPSADELKNIAKSLFEQYRNSAFNVLRSEFPLGQLNLVKDEIFRGKAEMVKFLKTELKFLRNEYLAKKGEIETLLEDINKDIALINGQVLSEIQSVPVIGDLRLETILRTDAAINVQRAFREYEKLFSASNLYDVNDAASIEKYLRRKIEDLFAKVLVNAAGQPIEIDFPPVGAIQKIYYDKSGLFQNAPTTFNIASRRAEPNFIFQTLGTDLNQTGYLQLKKKIEDFDYFIAKNKSGNEFQQDVVKELTKANSFYENYKKKLTDETTGLTKQVTGYIEKDLAERSSALKTWKENVDKLLNNYASQGKRLSGETRDIIQKIEDKLVKVNPYIDFLRRIDPYFYYQEYERIAKEVNDIKRRFSPDVVQRFEYQIKALVKDAVDNYQRELENYLTSAMNGEDLQRFIAQKDALLGTLDKDIIRRLPQELQNAYAQLNTLITDAREGLNKLTELYENKKAELRSYIKEQEGILRNGINEVIDSYINSLTEELLKPENQNRIAEIQERINKAKNIYRLLTSIKQQDITYNWNTTNFKDVNLGLITFKKYSNPNTKLTVGVSATTHFSQDRFPPTIEKITTYSENKLTNFGIGFFNILTVGFSEAVFTAGSERSTHFSIKIKDVKFDGALSFVQKFESWLKTLGKGLILRLESNYVMLGYSLAIPSINTPSFSFFNLSLNFDIRIYFDKRPMRFGFSFARLDSKFGIAAGVYAGFGYFGLVGELKRGIVEIDCALEAGAWKGISIGPMSGEVKLAFGFRYTKNDFGVRLEGYIVAEGRLTVWIIEVSQRIYIGVVSENSYVEGICSVTYSAKIGFIRKSFTGTFRQKISGAKSNNNMQNAQRLTNFFFDLKLFGNIAEIITKAEMQTRAGALQMQFANILDTLDEENPDGKIETGPVSKEAWKKFISVM